MGPEGVLSTSGLRAVAPFSAFAITADLAPLALALSTAGKTRVLQPLSPIEAL